MSMEKLRLYDVIDKEEPRGQSVSYQGIPCTARHCCTNLNRLTDENEQLKERNEKLIKKLDRLEQYIETIFNNESFVCKHLDIEEVQFYCERNQDYCSPTCAYRKCYDENVMFRLVDKIREATE